YAASLKDVITGARRTGVPLRIVHDEGSGAEEYFAREFPDLERGPQSAGDLGHRLREAFASAFAAGTSAVVVIGSDSPTLPISHLREGLTATRETGAALGPADDGG